MGKGGSSTSVEIPAYIEDAAKKNLTRADKISALGSVPLSFGPTAAAFTPMQTSAFTNTADQAMSFGLNAPTGDAAMYGGMNAPTTYANGISAYSAMPLYNNIMDEFAATRPGQKDYIDSFFIDPFTGATGYNVGNPIDYTTYANTTDNVATTGGGGGGGGGGGAGGGGAGGGGSYNPVIIDVPYDVPEVIVDNTKTDGEGNPAPFIGVDQYDPEGDDNFLTQDEFNDAVNTIKTETGFDDYDPTTDVIYGTDYQNDYVNSDDAQLAADTIYNNNQVIYGNETGNNVTSLTTGGDNWSGVTGDDGNSMSMEDQITAQADAYADTGTTFNMNDPSTWIDAGTAYNQPNINTDDSTPPPGIVGNNDTGSNTLTQTLANVFTPFDDTTYVDGELQYNDNVNDDDGGADGTGDDGCVIATHAVASGGFTPNMKREAVVWCMHKLHDRWWGEAVRRGYRYLGRKKIEQGKARDHYAEFRRYIDFASGKRRTLRGALTFTLRTAQFFAVGLIRKDA